MRRSRLLLHRHLWIRRSNYSTFPFEPNSSTKGDKRQMEEIEYRLGRVDPIGSQRHFLFPDLGDKKLSEAGSVEEVFKIYSGLYHKDYRQTCQAIATLFHLQKSFRNVLDISINNLYIQYSALNKFNKALHEETPFNELIKDFHSHFSKIPLPIASFIFLCLTRLGISFKTQLMSDMLLSFHDQFNDISPESLSYIAVGIRYTVNRNMDFEVRPRIWWCLYLIDALPSLRASLEKASTPDELNQLTICVFSLRTVMSNELIQLYLDKVKEIILEPTLVVDEPLVQRLVKIASVIENILSQDDNDFNLKESDVIPKIIFLLKNKLHQLRWVRLVRLSGLLQKIGEGSSVIREELLRALRSIYNDEVISNGSYSKLKVMTEMLKLEKRTFSFGEWLSFTDMILGNNKGPDFYFHVNDILQMSSSIDFVNPREEERFIEVLGAACRTPNETDMLRFFGNYQVNKQYLPESLLNSPELHAVEKEAIKRLNDSLMDTFIVSTFVNKLSYILAYINENHEIDDTYILKFRSMSPQINALNLFKLSFSFGRAIRSHNINSSPNLKALGKIILERIDEISSQDLKGNKLIIFLKALRRLNMNIKNEETKKNIQNLIKKVVMDYPVSIELILSLSEFLVMNKVHNPLDRSTIKSWMEFVVENQRHSESYDCIHSILNMAHKMNIDISENEDFITLVHKSIYRNIAFERCSSILEMTLVLITYRCLSEQLIQMIFSLEFMEKIDKELAESSKVNTNAHLHRVRICLMRLNRAAHLLHPEFKIPWFHQKFCQENNEAIMRRLRKIQNGLRRSLTFENGIYDSLMVLFGDPKFISYGVFSPYFHHIPFEINFEEGNVVDATMGLSFTAIRHSKLNLNKLKKFAIFPLYQESNRGEFQLQSRELETLGYTVIGLEEKEWNSMKMSCDDSKSLHLKKCMSL
ncbi:FAST kinase domain-containing protein 1, mitochondrial [Lepeophtheirus salmonis]|uniref:FAST kinase domain-containing protein 1, mitochondrial n=1 Tax=Lepeophtheirus salmonis TaxID=72036 RepID=UPI001AE7969C|nr:FAST kinase domain-containing protein 1, mitochondrial-like [Lepeophtheirus salmonis]